MRWQSKPRQLFTLLLSAPTGIIGREEVADSLWPDVDPVLAHRNLSVALSDLRKLLSDRELIQAHGPQLELRVPPEARDDIRFEEAATAALTRPNPTSVSSALSLYTGIYLPMDRYNDWTGYRRQVLTELRRQLVFAAEKTMPEDATLLPWLRELVNEDSCDEQATRSLMSYYLHMGRRAEALRVYRFHRLALAKELEVGPSQETDRLYQAVLSA